MHIFIGLLTLATCTQVNLQNCVDSCSRNGECHEIYDQLLNANETSPSFLCKCFEGFTNFDCSECEFGRFGRSCELCPIKNKKTCAGNGLCDMGIKGTGKCKCFDGFNPNTECFEEDNFLDLWHQRSKSINLLLLALAACIALMHVMQKIPKIFIPSTCGAILLGIGLGLIFKVKYSEKGLNEALSFDPQIFFLVILPPIMFEAGFSLQKREFFNNFGTIMVFGIPGTILTSFLFGLGLYSLSINTGLYNFSMIECMLFGSLISALDPVATLKIFSAMGLDSQLQSIVLGESVINDAIAITTFKILANYEENSN